MSPTQFTEQSAPTLLDTLRSIRFRVKLLSVLFGIGLVVAGAVGLLLATVLLDYFLNMPSIPRAMLVLASLGVVFWGMWKFTLRPLASRISLGDVAGHLETAFPQFEDRLRSTVDFVRSGLAG
jgi:hypothetical protein